MRCDPVLDARGNGIDVMSEMEPGSGIDPGFIKVIEIIEVYRKHVRGREIQSQRKRKQVGIVEARSNDLAGSKGAIAGSAEGVRGTGPRSGAEIDKAMFDEAGGRDIVVRVCQKGVVGQNDHGNGAVPAGMKSVSRQTIWRGWPGPDKSKRANKRDEYVEGIQIEGAVNHVMSSLESDGKVWWRYQAGPATVYIETRLDASSARVNRSVSTP
jgi:hypothetical protein